MTAIHDYTAAPEFAGPAADPGGATFPQGIPPESYPPAMAGNLLPGERRSLTYGPVPDVFGSAEARDREMEICRQEAIRRENIERAARQAADAAVKEALQQQQAEKPAAFYRADAPQQQQQADQQPEPASAQPETPVDNLPDDAPLPRRKSAASTTQKTGSK